MFMRALVTGGAGFIGSHLVDRLVSRGDEVLVVDNLSSGVLEFIQGHIDSGAVDFHQVDLKDLDSLKPLLNGVDMVYHLAANPDIRLGTRITDTDLKEGTIATYNVLESMRLANVEKIAFASSSVVYGENAPMPTPENHGPCLPISLYGASKQAGEGLIGFMGGNFWSASMDFQIRKHHWRARNSWSYFRFHSQVESRSKSLGSLG